MLKKLSVFFAVLCAFFLYFTVNAAAHMPDIVINGNAVNCTDGFYFESGSIYIKPEVFNSFFGVSFSFDPNTGFYTSATPVRRVVIDINTGDIHITDTNSFSSALEHHDVLYKDGYLKLRAICESLGISIWYDEGKHIAYAQEKDYFVGFFNKSGMAIACRNRMYGIVDSKGDIVLPFEYDRISNYENAFVYNISKGGKYGLADNNGIPVTDVIYTLVEYVSDEEIYLYIDNKKGMCNLKGDIIVPVEHEEILFSGNSVAMVKKDGRWYLYNSLNGEYSDDSYDEAYKLTEGIHTENYLIKGYYVSNDDKWGFIDSFGNKMIPLEYDGLDKFDSFGRARMVQNSKMGIIDCGGNIIIPAVYDYVYPFGTKKVTVVQLGKRYGALKLDGTIAIPLVYDYIHSFNNADVTTAYKDGRFSVINTKGEAVSTTRYIYAEGFKNGIALVQKKNYSYGYIDYNGKEIIPCIHNEVKQGTSHSILLKKSDKWALFLPSGENLTGYIYHDAEEFENGLAAVSTYVNGKKKFGYINSYGREIIPFIYDSASKFKYGRAVVSTDGRFGIIDVDGVTVIPFEYGGFTPSYDYNVIAACDLNGKWGLISFMNERITKFEYDYISEFEDNYAVVMKNGKYGLINTSGFVVSNMVYLSPKDAIASVKSS